MNNKEENKTEITHLLCREIQAPLVSKLIKGFAKDIGEEKAFATAKEIIKEDAISAAKALAEKYSGGSFKDLLKIVEEVWAKNDTLKLDNVVLDETKLDFDVVECGYAKMYDKLGIKEMGSMLSCIRDFAFAGGFNPDIELIRTKTIMDGADCCDFRFRLKNK